MTLEEYSSYLMKMLENSKQQKPESITTKKTTARPKAVLKPKTFTR